MSGLSGQVCVVCWDRYVHFYVWFVGTDTSISMCGLLGQIRTHPTWQGLIRVGERRHRGRLHGTPRVHDLLTTSTTDASHRLHRVFVEGLSEGLGVDNSKSSFSENSDCGGERFGGLWGLGGGVESQLGLLWL